MLWKFYTRKGSLGIQKVGFTRRTGGDEEFKIFHLLKSYVLWDG